MTFAIRDAVAADRREIALIENESGVIHHEGEPMIFREDRTELSEEELRKIIEDPDQTMLVAVNEEEKVIGCLYARLVRFRSSEFFTDHDRYHIESLAVLSTARRQGVGRALMQEAEKRGKAFGVQEITLHVWSFNEKAAALYGACGFRPLQTLMVKFNDEEEDRAAF